MPTFETVSLPAVANGDGGEGLFTAFGKINRNFAALETFNELNSVNVRDQFEADPTGAADSSDAIEEAIIFARETRRAVYVPSGIYLITRTLPIVEGMRIHGDGAGGGYPPPNDEDGNSYTDENPALAYVRTYGQSILFMEAGADVPMFENDPDQGLFLRESNSAYDGRGVVDQEVYNAEFSDIVLHGNARSQTKYNCDLIRLTDAWSIGFRNVLFAMPAGYFVRATNCNCIRLTDCMFSGDSAKSKGIFFFDTADCIINGGMLGGVVGPALWMAAPTCWLNNIGNVHFGDTQRIDIGGLIQGVAANVMTLSEDPRLETGDPCVFYNHSDEAGTLPTDREHGEVVFAIRISATEFAFNESYPLAMAGTKSTIVDTGTLCWLKPGPNACLYSSMATMNIFGNLRFDNGIDGSVILEDSSDNTLIGCMISQPGFDINGTRTTRGTGAWIRSGTRNKLIGNTFYACYYPMRIASAGNYILDNTEVSALASSIYAAGNYFSLNSTDGALALTGAFSAAPGTGVVPMTLTATNTPTVALLNRAGSVTVAMALRLSENVDNVGADVLYAATGAGQHIAGFSGSSSLSEIIVGGDALTAASKTMRIRGGLSTGTNIAAGGDLALIAPGGTGNAAPGNLLLQVPARTSSGSNYQTTPTTVLTVNENYADFAKPPRAPRMTRAQRDALTPQEGMIVDQTDSTPGLRWYENGAWVRPTVSADP